VSGRLWGGMRDQGNSWYWGPVGPVHASVVSGTRDNKGTDALSVSAVYAALLSLRTFCPSNTTGTFWHHLCHSEFQGHDGTAPLSLVGRACGPAVTYSAGPVNDFYCRVACGSRVCEHRPCPRPVRFPPPLAARFPPPPGPQQGAGSTVPVVRRAHRRGDRPVWAGDAHRLRPARPPCGEAFP
jgi:hypothetical protein